MILYSKNSAGNHQGLLIDEATGRTVALAYDASETTELARRWNAFEPGGEVERLVKAAFREGCKEEMLKPSSFGKSLIGISDDEFIEALWADSEARAALAVAKGGAA